ncbi:MAG: bifunctional 5,10-methylenetetrahydrofolate dehydrogenase/5,10-methenyltetrahydrofolate cyclohydrolase [Candidatus Moraniibacteriota bacterium]
MIISGTQVAKKIFDEANDIASGLLTRPGLGVVLVGDDPASRLYVGIKERRAEELGFLFRKEALPSTATVEEIVRVINELNADGNVHGIIIQLPLPDGLDTDRIIATIDPKKDADGFHPETVRRFLSDDQTSIPVFPEAIMELAKSSRIALSGKNGIAVVHSELFGSIMKKAFEYEGIIPTIISATEVDERMNEISNADIVVTAIGQPEQFSRDIFKSGAIVIDGGISEKNGKVCGDVSAEGSDAALFLTPVPGGVGPVTVACLLRRTARLAVTA